MFPQVTKICRNTYNIDQAGAFFKSTDASEERDEQHHNSDHDDKRRWWEEVVLEEEGDIVVDRVDGRSHRDYKSWRELEIIEKL